MNKKKLISLLVFLAVLAAVAWWVSPKSRLTTDRRGFLEAQIKLFGSRFACSQPRPSVYGWDTTTQSFKPARSIPSMKGEPGAAPYMLDGQMLDGFGGWCDYDSCSDLDFTIPLSESVYVGEVKPPENTGGPKDRLIPSYKTVSLTHKAKVDIEYYRLPFCKGPIAHYSKVFELPQ